MRNNLLFLHFFLNPQRDILTYSALVQFHTLLHVYPPSKLAKHKTVVKIPTIILRSTHLWPHHLVENIFLNLSIVCLFRLLVPPRENISRPEGGTVAKAKPSHNSNTSILVEILLSLVQFIIFHKLGNTRCITTATTTNGNAKAFQYL